MLGEPSSLTGRNHAADTQKKYAMGDIEIINLLLLGLATGSLCLAIPVGFLALRASPWWRKRAKRKKRSAVSGVSGQSMPAKVWAWAKIVVLACVDAGAVGLVVVLSCGLLVAFVGMPFGLVQMLALPLGLLAALAVFIFHVQEANAEMNRTGAVKFLGKSVISDLLSSMFTPKAGGRASSSDLLPSGHSRSEYHRYGAADGDIEFWGLDQPGAPPPEAAGWVIGDMMDEMDADGDGLIDDPFDDPFF